MDSSEEMLCSSLSENYYDWTLTPWETQPRANPAIGKDIMNIDMQYSYG